eukprot:Opistho-2@83350
MPPLPPKEQGVFKQILKFYETKQYKKGLKACDSILKKYADHGETTAMKGLILSCMGPEKKEESYTLARLGLRQDLKSHVCWHVLGLLYRQDKNYEEAMKCYKNALRQDKDNMQILRDLSLLQVQMRDLDGFMQTRLQLLTARPSQKISWIGLVVAYHLRKDYDAAIQCMTSYETTQETESTTPDHFDQEKSELILYKFMILEESGRHQDALDAVFKQQAAVCDKRAVKEIKARLLLKLGRKDESAAIYRALLKENPDNRDYYTGLEEATSATEGDARLKLYEELRSTFPRAGFPKRTPLDFTTGETFAALLDAYMRPLLRKGIPSLFNSLRGLYTDAAKVATIESIAVGYRTSLKAVGKFSNSESAPEEPPSTYMWSLHFLSQHYDALGRTSDALACIEEALLHTPTLIDLYIVKARVLKHGGDIQQASLVMNEARELDTADRYVNSKCVKYMTRADKRTEAEQTIGLFTRDGVDQADNLTDMQCMWYELECGESWRRSGDTGRALKQFHLVEKHFGDITEDQFDFHSYCMRKMTMRAYIRLVRLEDRLRGHRFYVKAAIDAIGCYLAIFDRPPALDSASHQGIDPNLSETEKKKLLSKQRREKAKNEAAAAKEAEDKKNAATKSDAKGEKGAAEKPVKAEDPDANGELLLKTADPLGEAIKFLRPLQLLLSGEVRTHLLAYQIYKRRGKPLLILQSLRRAHHVDPTNAELHHNIVEFASHFAARKDVHAAVREVVDSELKALLGGLDVKSFNTKFLAANTSSLVHQLHGGLASVIVDASTAAKVVATITKTDGSVGPLNLKNATAIHAALAGPLKSVAGAADAYRTTCHALFPAAVHFGAVSKGPAAPSAAPESSA